MTQPKPIANEQPHIADLVIEDIKLRKEQGILKYGVPLQPFNGRDAGQDLYEELMDAVQYAKQMALEFEELKVENAQLKADLVRLGESL